MATTQTLGQIRLWRPWAGKSFILDGPRDGILEAASQTYKAGELVYWASGLVTAVTESSNQVTAPILGQALKAGANVAAALTSPKVRIIHPGDVYLANFFHSTPASAVIAQDNIGTVYGLWKSSTSDRTLGFCYVDGNSVSTVEDGTHALGRVQVVGIPDSVDGVANAIGDTYGFLLVRFLMYSLASDGNPNQRLLQFCS